MGDIRGKIEEALLWVADASSAIEEMTCTCVDPEVAGRCGGACCPEAQCLLSSLDEAERILIKVKDSQFLCGLDSFEDGDWDE